MPERGMHLRRCSRVSQWAFLDACFRQTGKQISAAKIVLIMWLCQLRAGSYRSWITSCCLFILTIDDAITLLYCNAKGGRDSFLDVVWEESKSKRVLSQMSNWLLFGLTTWCWGFTTENAWWILDFCAMTLTKAARVVIIAAEYLWINLLLLQTKLLVHQWSSVAWHLEVVNLLQTNLHIHINFDVIWSYKKSKILFL